MMKIHSRALDGCLVHGGSGHAQVRSSGRVLDACLKVATILLAAFVYAPVAAAQCGNVNILDGTKAATIPLVRAYTVCGGGPFYPNPNDSALGGMPACSPPLPAELSEHSASSLRIPPLPTGPTPYSFAGTDSGCSVSIGAPKLEDPCSDGSGQPCTNARVKLRCKGIVDGSNVPVVTGSPPWYLAITFRSTLHQSGQDLTVGDTTVEIGASPKDGKVTVSTDLAQLYLPGGRHILDPCVTNEVVEVALLDPTWRPFAVSGVAAPGDACTAYDVPGKTKGMKMSMPRAYSPCPGTVFGASNTTTTEGTAACTAAVPAENADSSMAHAMSMFGAACIPNCTPLVGPSQYRFADSGSRCELKVGPAKIKDPCPYGTFGPCTDMAIKLKCSGIVDSLGVPIEASPGRGGFSLGLVLRTTMSEPGNVPAEKSIMDYPFDMVAAVSGPGEVTLTTSLASVLDRYTLPVFIGADACFQAAIVEAFLLDFDGRIFASIGRGRPVP